jgi:hypothetical protein
VISHGPKVFFLSLILACGASAQIDSPNFRYVAINFPGAVFTAPTGINNLDAIVGYYEVSMGTRNTGSQHRLKTDSGPAATLVLFLHGAILDSAVGPADFHFLGAGECCC